MGFFAAQRPRFIFVVYLALSVMGIFTFAAAADLPAFDFWKSKPAIDGSIVNADADYATGCLAEYISVKARGCSFLPSRKSMHIITFFGTLCAGIITSFSVTKIAKPIKAPNGKNTFLLNLRI
jgi:hypothetical protein